MPLSGTSYVPSAYNQIDFLLSAGGTHSETFVLPSGITSFDYVNSICTQMDEAIRSQAAGVASVGTTYEIDSINLASFDVTSDTIIVTGKNFTSANIGKLFLEDAAGGLDFNGYYMTGTFIDSTHASFAPGGSGDANLGPGSVIIAYVDTIGLRSNILYGTNAAGTVVMIP